MSGPTGTPYPEPRQGVLPASPRRNPGTSHVPPRVELATNCPPNTSQDAAWGSWSVALAIHWAEDPARPKRVLRIVRLHLGAYAEACLTSSPLDDASIRNSS